jgi:hypothetical protein
VSKTQKENKNSFIAAANFSLFTFHFSLKIITFASDKTKTLYFYAYESNY